MDFKHTDRGWRRRRREGAGLLGRPLALPLALMLALALVEVAGGAAPEQPLLGGAFKVCSRSDPQLEQCILDSLNGARDKLANGIPALSLPRLEPLHVRRSDMREGEEDFNLQLTFTNVSWSGLSDFVATKARFQFFPPYLELVTTLKNMTFVGPYEFGGSLLTLRMNGHGDALFNWGAHITHRMHFEEEMRKGVRHWRASEYTWQMDAFHFRCHFTNLFSGNKRLGLYANQFVNRNWKPAYALYAPVVNRAHAAVFKEALLDPFLARVPLDRLFAP